MHRKVFLLLVASLLVLVAAGGPVALAESQIGNQTALQTGDEPLATPPPTDLEAADLGPARVYPASGSPGFYIESGRFNILGPADAYHATGTFAFWAWSQLNAVKGGYNFNELDAWIQAAADQGYQEVGIAIYTYISRFSSCPLQGIDPTPAWVRNGPNGVLETFAAADNGKNDDAVLVSDVLDSRNSAGCINYNGPWYLPDYIDPYYKSSYNNFIIALADHLLSSPHRDRVGWVAIGMGRDGENKAADDMDDASLQANGLTQTAWLNFAFSTIDMYRGAFYDGAGFPRIQLITQNAPFYLSSTERREIANYAASRRVGVSINNITSDFNFTESCGSANPNVRCTGMYDQARQYNSVIPISLESYDYMMGTPNEFYWSMLAPSMYTPITSGSPISGRRKPAISTSPPPNGRVNTWAKASNRASNSRPACGAGRVSTKTPVFSTTPWNGTATGGPPAAISSSISPNCIWPNRAGSPSPSPMTTAWS